MAEVPYLNPVETLQILEMLKDYDSILFKAKYDPAFGDERLCKCGDPYRRHFDPYETNNPHVGCKYCECPEFEPADK